MAEFLLDGVMFGTRPTDPITRGIPGYGAKRSAQRIVDLGGYLHGGR